MLESQQYKLSGGTSEGVEVVRLCNGRFQIEILPTRGMGIWKATCDGVPIGWQSPVSQPVHPQFVDLRGRNGLGWLDGFSELLCRCGLSFNGPPGCDEAAGAVESEVTLHGRIANLPARDVVIIRAENWIEVTGVVEETTMFGPRLALKSTIRLAEGASEFTVTDQITNLGANPAEWELLYHWNVGRPFLGENSRFDAAAQEVAPRDARAAEGIADYPTYLGPTPGYAEQVYFFDLAADKAGQTSVLLSNAAADRGFSLEFNTHELPCFSLWKCTQPEAAGYVTGLEPAVNFPNFKAYERKHGRVRKLAPGESKIINTTVKIAIGPSEVSGIREKIRLISPPVPVIHDHPQTGWSA